MIAVITASPARAVAAIRASQDRDPNTRPIASAIAPLWSLWRQVSSDPHPRPMALRVGSLDN